MVETTPQGTVVPEATAPGAADHRGVDRSTTNRSTTDQSSTDRSSTDRSGVVDPSAARQRWWRSGGALFHGHPHRFDAALAVLIVLLTVGGMLSAQRMGTDEPPPEWVWLVVGIGCGALLFRRSHPWPVLFVTTAAYLILQAFSHDVPPLILAVVTALVTITLAGQRGAAIVSAVVITLLALAIGSILDAEYWSHPRPVAIAAICALAIALADAVRNRRAYVAAVEERARRAEESRDEDARRRVADERLRIARELHDVLAHHIAVINVQAGVAGHLMDRKPEQAREALDHVRAAARSVLSEMQAVVSVLREPGAAGEQQSPQEPSPGLSAVDDLLDGFRSTGLTIDVVVSGAPVPLAGATDLVAYRVVQESLTNVRKHAGKADVVVRFDHRPGSLSVTVANTGTGQHSEEAGRLAGATGGFGLLGMRERVSSVGGHFTAAPTADGGFRVAVTLPVQPS